ncbi:hypothetical protein CR513_51186, partial [Mucuna pruriens]
MEGNTHHTHFKNSYNPMTLYLKGHAHEPHTKMRLSSPSLGNESPFTWLFGHPHGCYDSLHSPIFVFPLFSNSLPGPLKIIPMPCPSSVKPLRNKFVFSIKLYLDGSKNRYKAQLVMLGNKQEYGLDYDKTFSLVSKKTIMCTILALVA